MALRQTTRLTKATIKKFPAPDPSGKQTLHWDSELKGFGVLCSGVSTVKSFVVQRENKAKIPRRTIGRINYMPDNYSLDEVRIKADQWLENIRYGIDEYREGKAAAALHYKIKREEEKQKQHLYRHWDAAGTLLYVGISLSVLHRIASHKSASNWYWDIAQITLETFPSRREALEAEKDAIINERPLFNENHNRNNAQ